MPILHRTLRRSFVADHHHDLPGFQEPRHGHNWEVDVTAETPDEGALAHALDTWVQTLDYTVLNEQPRLTGRNPTAEVLAQWLFEDLDRKGLNPIRVRLREKAHYWAACLREAP